MDDKLCHGYFNCLRHSYKFPVALIHLLNLYYRDTSWLKKCASYCSNTWNLSWMLTSILINQTWMGKNLKCQYSCYLLSVCNNIVVSLLLATSLGSMRIINWVLYLGTHATLIGISNATYFTIIYLTKNAFNFEWIHFLINDFSEEFFFSLQETIAETPKLLNHWVTLRYIKSNFYLALWALLLFCTLLQVINHGLLLNMLFH